MLSSTIFTNVGIGDPAMHMYDQAKHGPVDAIKGDYIADANLANHAVEIKYSTGPGWVPTAWNGLQQTFKIDGEKRNKIVINGGAINPRGLAEETHKFGKENGIYLTVAYVDGDNAIHKAQRIPADIKSGALTHLDGHNENVYLVKDSLEFLDHPETMLVVCANAYLGHRAVKAGLDQGADIMEWHSYWNREIDQALACVNGSTGSYLE
ncbi:hypothetical protein IFM61606_07727 [Aspergillus udagawae]|uniref:Acyclic terpene utilisation N-terminal domain-containing protein n=1 Tax=Aspergillus udagawae TaxID=91492 RepID=A0ABQ1B8D8_9EURO|nr:hypothetical protein IFM53868_08287 [Aspergillus udagawae]GFG14220.1 hypothetical protein IFM5058_06842 [Aspergillus udagawae]GFG27677.1 hypothetical protein IFM61606_07727 [Aspergillus udagawae]